MKGGKKEGCFKEHWKVVLWVVVMVAAITFIVVDVVINWNAIGTVFALSTCIGDQFIPSFSREIVVSDSSKCWSKPYQLDLTRYKYVESIEICDNCFYGKLNLNGLNRLRSIRIGNTNFRSRGVLNLIGLKKLESVVIGSGSFDGDSGDYFYLKDCPKVRELRIGRASFSGSSKCKIENVPSLEVIEIGGKVFRTSSLELKSILIHNE